METRVRICERMDKWTNVNPAAPRTQSLLLLVSYWECSPAVAHGTQVISDDRAQNAARECEFRAL